MLENEAELSGLKGNMIDSSVLIGWMLIDHILMNMVIFFFFYYFLEGFVSYLVCIELFFSCAPGVYLA